MLYERLTSSDAQALKSLEVYFPSEGVDRVSELPLSVRRFGTK